MVNGVGVVVIFVLLCLIVLLFQSCCFWCCDLVVLWFGNLFATDFVSCVCVALVFQVSMFAVLLLVVAVLLVCFNVLWGCFAAGCLSIRCLFGVPLGFSVKLLLCGCLLWMLGDCLFWV